MEDFEKLSREELIARLIEFDEQQQGGIRLTYPGQTPPWQIVRRVQPRAQQIDKRLSFGDEEEQSRNVLVEGENLQALVSLYKYRGQVDLVLTDPPYNTGQDFRYNDRWDEDPNDPDLGTLVPADDGSRHSKWLRFMTPRLWMMKEMLKPGGVLAICIDHRELFRLGLLLDQLFGEQNRLGIINWQKTTSKNDRKHIASTTEYVLVYSKDEGKARTQLLERSSKADARFRTMADADPFLWKQGDIAAQGERTHPTMVYQIQSPFTGELHPPPSGRHWAAEKRRMKTWLQEWGSVYAERELHDGRRKALVIKGAPIPGEADFSPEDRVLAVARKKAQQRLKAGAWPRLYFGVNGTAKPMYKVYEHEVKAGSVPTSFWVDVEDGDPFEIGNVSWLNSESGRSREGVEELDALVGRGHEFTTVKPMRLFTKIVQIWCPPSGIVLDPFAGSGTAGHAVMQVNAAAGGTRRFVLIEQGRPERGDSYAKTLTAKRLRHAITGERVGKDRKVSVSAEPLPGGFRFSRLTEKVDAKAVLALEREEMIDLLLTTHWDVKERSAGHLRRLAAGTHEHLFAISSTGEGFFLIWNGPDQESVLNRAAFRSIADQAEEAGLLQPYHVYARQSTYSGPNVEFYQIPNRILEKLGFNEATQPYGVASADEQQPAISSETVA